MSNPTLALLMLGAFIFIIMLGFPIAFTLMAMGVAFGFYAYFTPHQDFFDNRVFYLFTQNTFSVMNSDILVAIPLFLFMGYMIERSNILDRLFLSLLYGRKPVVTGAFTIPAFEIMRDLQVAVRGSLEALREKPLTIFSCCPTARRRTAGARSAPMPSAARCPSG